MLNRINQLITKTLSEVITDEPPFDTEGLLILVIKDHWEDPDAHRKEGGGSRKTFVVHKSFCYDLNNKWDTYEVWTYSNDARRLFKTTRGFEEVKDVPYRSIYKDSPEWVQVTKRFD